MRAAWHRRYGWLRQSLHSRVRPVPWFEYEVFRGPCDALGLPEGRSVIAVSVPESASTPHIHSNGRIYTRVADSSEPDYVRDRYLLDELTRRGNHVREATRSWVKADPEFDLRETEAPMYV